MPSQSKLDACSKRYVRHLEQLRELVDVVATPISETGNRDVLYTLEAMVIVVVVAYLEEFLTCVIGLACLHREGEVRAFLAAHGNPHEKRRVTPVRRAT